MILDWCDISMHTVLYMRLYPPNRSPKISGVTVANDLENMCTFFTIEFNHIPIQLELDRTVVVDRQ